MRIAVTCGYDKSFHAIALIHELAKEQEVVLCLRVGVFNLSRVKFYLRQIGIRKLLGKARVKLMGGKWARERTFKEISPMLQYLKSRSIPSKTVSATCRHTGTKHVAVKSLNSRKAIEELTCAKPDLIVYAGGGILKQEFLDVPRLGVLNAHGGPLPSFRGMNAEEWALLHGIKPFVTIHYIDRGIDTGPIFFLQSVPDEACASIPDLRGHATRIGVEALLECVRKIDKGLEPKGQNRDDGRQYFIMADPMLEVLERWLEEGRTPLHTAPDVGFPPRGGLSDAQDVIQ